LEPKRRFTNVTGNASLATADGQAAGSQLAGTETSALAAISAARAGART
jgi:hypothetical protein